MGGKKVIIVGAGPGGLTAGMLLASRGFEVEILEKEAVVGGRNAAIEMDGFVFDTGPTFLMMRYVLDEIFALASRKTSDYLDIREVDPLYRLRFDAQREFFPSRNREATAQQIARLFPGDEKGYERFLANEERKLAKAIPCLQVPYGSFFHLARLRLLKALPFLDIHRTLYDHLASYFDHPDLRIAFTFQAKYLGMSPWQCPGLFSIISLIEHGQGLYHPIGGLHRISTAMARAVREDGGTIRLSTPVQEILVENGRAVGVRLQDGERLTADFVIVNADFAHAMTRLVPEQHRRKYTDKAIAGKRFSCSTFMLYLGTDRTWDIPHHNIIFAPDYRKNVAEIAEAHELSRDPSVYVQNPCVLDPSMAPPGKSALYVLVPITNNESGIDWEKETPAYRELVLDILESRAGLAGLRSHIVCEKVLTPLDWEQRYNVYRGATFNLAHNVGQMLVWRPHNRFEEFKGCYLVGGGTHPGSGLPTIYESARISAELLMEDAGIRFPFAAARTQG